MNSNVGNIDVKIATDREDFSITHISCKDINQVCTFHTKNDLFTYEKLFLQGVKTLVTIVTDSTSDSEKDYSFKGKYIGLEILSIDDVTQLDKLNYFIEFRILKQDVYLANQYTNYLQNPNERYILLLQGILHPIATSMTSNEANGTNDVNVCKIYMYVKQFQVIENDQLIPCLNWFNTQCIWDQYQLKLKGLYILLNQRKNNNTNTGSVTNTNTIEQNAADADKNNQSQNNNPNTIPSNFASNSQALLRINQMEFQRKQTESSTLFKTTLQTSKPEIYKQIEQLIEDPNLIGMTRFQKAMANKRSNAQRYGDMYCSDNEIPKAKKKCTHPALPTTPEEILKLLKQDQKQDSVQRKAKAKQK